jgi:hypothetical protein
MPWVCSTSTSNRAASSVRAVAGSYTLTSPPRCTKKTRPVSSMSMASGSSVLPSSWIFSKLWFDVAPQSPSTTPAAHWMPPSRCCTNSGSSVNADGACPMPVYQDRPPSKFWHQLIGWSAPIRCPV